MLGFYFVDNTYINYLKAVDSRVPNVNYNSNTKFVCGVVLDINGCNYYVPVSHNVTAMRTSIIIRNNDGRDLGFLRFSFMFPCPSNVLSKVDIGSISKIDAKYANLLGMELSFCRSNEGIIFQKAKSVYTLGLDQGSFLGSKCCDFTKLELACSNYVKK